MSKEKLGVYNEEFDTICIFDNHKDVVDYLLKHQRGFMMANVSFDFFNEEVHIVMDSYAGANGSMKNDIWDFYDSLNKYGFFIKAIEVHHSEVESPHASWF